MVKIIWKSRFKFIIPHLLRNTQTKDKCYLGVVLVVVPREALLGVRVGDENTEEAGGRFCFIRKKRGWFRYQNVAWEREGVKDRDRWTNRLTDRQID